MRVVDNLTVRTRENLATACEFDEATAEGDVAEGVELVVGTY